MISHLTASDVELLNALDPAMQPFALRHATLQTDAGIPWHLTRTIASRSDQQRLAEQRARDIAETGTSSIGVVAPPGRSFHEVGFAYDFRGPRTDAEWDRAGRIVRSLGLVWGGDFRRTPERWHVQAQGTRDEYATTRLVRIGAIAVTVGATALITLGRRR